MPGTNGNPRAQADGDPADNGVSGGNREQGQAPVREAGTGALCPEAQADGVPCMEIGRDCEICEKAQLED